MNFCLQRKHVNEKGETPLHEAAIAGNSQRVKELLAKVSLHITLKYFFIDGLSPTKKERLYTNCVESLLSICKRSITC